MNDYISSSVIGPLIECGWWLELLESCESDYRLILNDISSCSLCAFWDYLELLQCLTFDNTSFKAILIIVMQQLPERLFSDIKYVFQQDFGIAVLTLIF